MQAQSFNQKTDLERSAREPEQQVVEAAPDEKAQLHEDEKKCEHDPRVVEYQLETWASDFLGCLPDDLSTIERWDRQEVSPSNKE